MHIVICYLLLIFSIHVILVSIIANFIFLFFHLNTMYILVINYIFIININI